MRSSGFIERTHPENILDMPQDDMMGALESTGAMNSVPPLAHSSHLKNKKTGLVLPWNELAAEQRDIMVNCDAHGNTDPEAWAPTVVEDNEADLSEKERLYWAARETVVRQATQMTGQHYANPKETTIPVANFVPKDVQSLDAYYDSLEKQMDTLNKELDF